ncbi:hypothetical protein GYH30_016431 [Glycine max]|nr:hypothetical protein GYH30_016431 [Glycine max]
MQSTAVSRRNGVVASIPRHSSPRHNVEAMDSTTFLPGNEVPFDVIAFSSNDVEDLTFQALVVTRYVGAAIPDLKSLPFNVVPHAGNVFEGKPTTTGLQSSPSQESCVSKTVEGDRRRLAGGLRRRLIQRRPCTVVELR